MAYMGCIYTGFKDKIKENVYTKQLNKVSLLLTDYSSASAQSQTVQTAKLREKSLQPHAPGRMMQERLSYISDKISQLQHIMDNQLLHTFIPTLSLALSLIPPCVFPSILTSLAFFMLPFISAPLTQCCYWFYLILFLVFYI